MNPLRPRSIPDVLEAFEDPHTGETLYRERVQPACTTSIPGDPRPIGSSQVRCTRVECPRCASSDEAPSDEDIVFFADVLAAAMFDRDEKRDARNKTWSGEGPFVDFLTQAATSKAYSDAVETFNVIEDAFHSVLRARARSRAKSKNGGG